MTEQRGVRTTKLLVALALCGAFFPALQPLLSDEMTCGYDNAFHLYRAVEIQHLWDHGVLFTRWAPDMALGFGFPLFVFAGPLAQALLAFVQRLGLAWPVAMNAVFALGIIAGGTGMYWLVRTLTGEEGQGRPSFRTAGGLLAAVAYVYAPFQAYDIFNRGSLWESLAWAFPPLILLGLHRWMLRRERTYLVLGTTALAAMVLCHYPFAALFAPVFGLWVVLHARLRRDWGVLWRGAVLAGLGLGLTAFFWVPPLLERGYIQTGRLLGTWVFDYRHNFLPFSQLVALPRRADPNLINDWPPKSLGMIPLLVALLPTLGMRRLSSAARWQVILLWSLVVGLAYLTLSPSLWLWDHLPLLSFVQFPWRFLGPAAFCLALLSGWAPAALFTRRAGFLAPGTAVLIVVIILASLGWFYPDKCDAPGNLTVPGILRWERLTDTLGTTAKGEYLPIWVERWPEVSLDDAYAESYPVPRMRVEDLPPGSEILNASYGPVSATIEILAGADFTARYLTFYYPGWHVTIDGRPVEVAPEIGTGVLTFDVPAGRHTVAVAFGETPLRLAGDSLSVAALLALVGVVVATKTDVRAGSASEERPEPPPHTALPSRESLAVGIWVLGGVALLSALKIGWVDPNRLLWRRSRLDASDGRLTEVALPLEVNFDHRALLMGSSALPQGVSAADTPVLVLYWRALDPGSHDWQVGLTLVGSDGTRWPVGTRPARWGRTPPPLNEWPPFGYARMDLLLDLPAGLAPGTYRLELALFDRATAAPASVLNERGNPIAPAFPLGDIRIVGPPAPPSLASLGMGAETGNTCGPVRSLGVEVSHMSAAPGELLTVKMAWESVEMTDEALTVAIVLADETGIAAEAWEVAPAAPWWPTTYWQPGERWLGKAEIRLPGSLDSGRYQLTLSVDDCPLVGRDLTVTAPSRMWQLPESFTPTEVVFGATLELAGYEIDGAGYAPGETVPLTLAWTALEEVDTSYRVFVHLADDTGQVVAQNDGEPAGWTRPTPGWAVGEIVLDPRPLQIPETAQHGRYEIRVGLYDGEGQRLLAGTGEDAVTIEVLALE